MKHRLIKLINESTGVIYDGDVIAKDEIDITEDEIERIADYLLTNGVIAPPCKVGDTMYKLCSVNSRIKMGDMWDGRIVKSNCDRCGYRNCPCYDIGLRHDHELMIDVVVPKKIHSLAFLLIIRYLPTPCPFGPPAL